MQNHSIQLKQYKRLKEMEGERKILPKVNSLVTHRNKMLWLWECLQRYQGLYGKKKSSTARLAVQRLVQLLHLLKPHKNHTVKSLKPKNWQTHSLFYALSIFSNFRLVPYNLARERSRDLELQRAQSFSK